MNERHPTHEELQDYVAGEGDTRVVAAHLAVCRSCADRLGELEELLRRLAGMPQEVVPPAWVWDGVTGEIGWTRGEGGELGQRRVAPAPDASLRRPAERSGGSASRGASAGVGRWLIAMRVAAVFVLAAGGLLMMRARRGGRGVDVDSTIASSGSGAAFDASVRAYRQSSAELAAVLEERKSALPPDAREALTRSLADLDRAIQGVQEALADHPDRTTLQTRLARTYRWKLEILKRAVRLTTEL